MDGTASGNYILSTDGAIGRGGLAGNAGDRKQTLLIGMAVAVALLCAGMWLGSLRPGPSEHHNHRVQI